MTCNVRKLLIGSASAIAMGCFMATPAISADLMDPVKPGPERTLSGTFDLYGGWVGVDDFDPNRTGTDSFDSDFPLLGGAARVDLPWSETFSVQLDLEGVAAFTDGTESGNGPSESDNWSGGAAAAAHLNYREVDQFLIGLFGGAGVVAINDTASTGMDPSIYFVGVEGQMYFGDFTAYGQVGYADSETDNSTNENLQDAFFIRGVGRYYFNGGHTKLEGEVSYWNGERENNTSTAQTDDVDVVGWGVQLTHQFYNWGNDGFIAGFVRYEGHHWDEDADAADVSHDYTDHMITLGVSIALNQYSVKTTERTGVALDIPDFLRVIGGTAALDPA